MDAIREQSEKKRIVAADVGMAEIETLRALDQSELFSAVSCKVK